MIWKNGINNEILELAKEKPEHKNLLDRYFRNLGDESFSLDNLDELVQNFHKRYSGDIRAWQQLDQVKRTALVELFYFSDQPPIPLYCAHIDSITLNFDHNFSELSKNQLLWIRENVSLIGNKKRHECSPSKVFALNKSLRDNNLPDAWNFEVTSEEIKYANENPDWAEHLNTYLSQTHRTYLSRAFTKNNNNFKDSPWALMGQENRAELRYLFYTEDLPFFGGSSSYSWDFDIDFNEISTL